MSTTATPQAPELVAFLTQAEYDAVADKLGKGQTAVEELTYRLEALAEALFGERQSYHNGEVRIYHDEPSRFRVERDPTGEDVGLLWSALYGLRLDLEVLHGCEKNIERVLAEFDLSRIDSARAAARTTAT
jgi:hypothetical protein